MCSLPIEAITGDPVILDDRALHLPEELYVAFSCQSLLDPIFSSISYNFISYERFNPTFQKPNHSKRQLRQKRV